MDHTPTLYRVAHMSDICVGMYNSGMACAALCERDRHPMPYDDMRLEGFYETKFRSRMKFAFGSIEQLKFWVYRQDVREALAQDGYVIYEIEPEGDQGVAWEIGDTQAIFSNAREIGIRDLRDI